ncbi:VlmK-like protein [Streptomyces viridochromogenes]|uniref:VlmK-like protein n=1 Tax=Streptomyces viridochromogenes TaxID=1938 RepID=A0A0J7ZB20_STRVR|nr:MmgE/PrpD family protein [Streptomyces viridochromogenes]KMS72368.1 VlmK-like protein [Streptomyces viridochromogenes]
MTPLQELCDWAARLTHDDLPERVRALAASQILSQTASIRAGAAHPLGARMIAAFGEPLQPDARQSACVLAGLGSWLNLDDTAYAGHLSNSTVAVPLAFAHAHGLTGARLIAAVVVANECAARITAAATLGPLRGQSAIHTHLVGAVCGRLHAEGVTDPRRWTDALGLALALPHRPLMRAFLASDARLLNALAPVRAAMDACDAAAAGLHGAPDLLEHPDGFLAALAAVPLPDEVTGGLGRRWHTETLSFKMRPGGPGIDAAVDCAIELHSELRATVGALDPATVAEALVEASLYTLYAGRRADRYVTGPDAPLGALVLHTPYPVATALLTGGLTVADFERPALAEAARWRLAERVRLAHDPELTRALFDSAAPFGAAVRRAGAAAEPWLLEFGGPETARIALDAARPPEPDFTAATKATGARVTVRLNDGRAFTRERLVPLGAMGDHTRACHENLVREKFVGIGGDADTAKAAAGLGTMDAGRLRDWVGAALAERA